MLTRNLFAAVQEWTVASYATYAAKLTITLTTGEEVHLPLRAELPAALPDAKRAAGGTLPPSSAAVFIPNAVQSAILKALYGKALNSTALAQLIGDKARLYRKPKGGMQELRDRGLVDHRPGLGYFRPDAPPEEMEEAGEEDTTP